MSYKKHKENHSEFEIDYMYPFLGKNGSAVGLLMNVTDFVSQGVLGSLALATIYNVVEWYNMRPL